MKTIRFFIFAGGIIFGLLLAGLLFVGWQIHQRPPGVYYHYPAPPFRGSLIISLFNATKQPIGATVALDNESTMSGALPGRSIIPSPNDFGANASLSPTLGKHQISVIVGDVGKIGAEEIIQEANKTNYVEIYIFPAIAGTNRFECKFFVHTNILGSM